MSLGGLNADQLAINAALRSLLGKSLGFVCINLQQTGGSEDSSLGVNLNTDDTYLPQISHSFPLGSRELEQDEKCTLRIFEKTDVVFEKLLRHMNLPAPTFKAVVGARISRAPSLSEKGLKHRCSTVIYGYSHAQVGRSPPKSGWKAEVPYDKNGMRSTDGSTTTLDLNRGAKLKLTKGHNVQGCRQPAYG